LFCSKNNPGLISYQSALMILPSSYFSLRGYQ